MFIHCELLILILVLINDGQAVIGGHEAVPHSRPYMVLLEWHFEDGKKGHCAGFLLNEDFVMTAASCRARSYTVFLDVQHFPRESKSGEVKNISVEQTFTHEDFDATYYKNNIMLLKLSTNAKFSKNVRPIALADQGDGSLPQSCSISGWGRTDRDSKYMSNVLMEVNVTPTDSEQCACEHLYCTEGDIGPSKGDAGGPLVCDGKAYGVASSIYEIDGQVTYTYSKIPYYRNWIDSTMKNALKSTTFFCLAH
ncbi:granzyme G-like [Centropristis striata]|uniref:granzyme G-like n=1 Tax=Centropristis striata TaxID=184440 RepID=UPI0027E147E9|nr:granzyme G-like [Centropristis striata]